MASSIVTSWEKLLNGAVIVGTFTCTAHTDGAFSPQGVFTAAEYKAIQGYLLTGMETDPGAGPPQADWDVTLVNAAGTDYLGGAGINRHTTTTLWTAPYISGTTYGARPIWSLPTLTITGNNVSGAVMVIKLEFQHPGIRRWV